MVSTEASRAEAFASQADRSRDQAAGYLQQTISTLKSVMIAKAQIGQWLAAISVPFRWEGTRLVLQGPDGVWVVGPDLAGLGIVGAEIVGGHLRFTFSSGVVSDLGQVVPDGDFAGPSSSVDGEFMLFDGVTGKRGKGSGKTVNSFAAAVHAHPVADLSDASAIGRLLLQAADAPAMRTLLQLVKGTSAGNIPVLDGDGKLATSVLPALALTDTFEVASQSAMLALAAQQGDIAIRTDLNKSFVLSSNAPGTFADWKELRTPTDLVLAVAGLTGTITAAALKTALAMTATDITDLSADGRSLIKAANYAAMRSLLNVDPSTLIVRDEKPNGTAGGGPGSAGWTTRTLNTVKVNTIAGASLSSNQITLPAGTYDVWADATTTILNLTKLRLRNVTDGSDLVVGLNSGRSSTSVIASTVDCLCDRFTLSAAKVLSLDMYSSVANVSGFGEATSAGIIEVYAELKIVKVA